MDRETDQLLAGAVAEAVEAGTRALDELEDLVDGVVKRLHDAAARPSYLNTVSEETLAGLDLLTTHATDALVDRVAATRRTMGTFNIAFFGRTGAGKSTLMSALG